MVRCSHNGVATIILLAIIMHVGTALNTKAVLQQLQDPNDNSNGQNNLCIKSHFVPELYVIGAIKAATTSLCTMLRHSPAMLWPMRSSFKNVSRTPAVWKEGHYFDYHKLEGFGYMATDFPKCDMQQRKVAVEASARYGSDPSIPLRMSKWYGQQKSRLKFVLIFREPLARLHSHYWTSVRIGWCPLHQNLSFSDTVNSIIWRKPTALNYVPAQDSPEDGPEQHPLLPEPQMPKRSPINGCGDYLEGSLYVNHIERYFKYFQPLQFTFVPFLFFVDPGQNGRPSGNLAEFLLSKLGVAQGVPSIEIDHSNVKEHPSLKEDLSEFQINAIRTWFDKLTGPELIADKIKSTGATLYEYQGDSNDVSQIAQWLRSNW